MGNQLLQFWEFYRDPSSEQNSQKLMTLTQAATSTTVSTKTGSTFRDWMLRKNRKYHDRFGVGLRNKDLLRGPMNDLEDRFRSSVVHVYGWPNAWALRTCGFLPVVSPLKQSFQRSIYFLLTCY